MATDEFEKWFHGYLLHKTASCLDRDILRWAKPILKHGFKLQSLTDLEFKGSQEFLDAWLNKTLEPQNDQLKKENEKLRKCVEFYADEENYNVFGAFHCVLKVADCDYNKHGGKFARQTLKELTN